MKKPEWLEKINPFNKDLLLKRYLEKQYNIKIVKRFNAFLLLKEDGSIINFFYSITDVQDFLQIQTDLEAYCKEHSNDILLENLLKKDIDNEN